MAQVAPVTPQPPPVLEFRKRAAEAEYRFELILAEPQSLAAKRAQTLTVSVIAHAVLLGLAILVPILTYNALPAPGEAVRAFFVAPPEAAPPPPPPPPPAPAARAAVRAAEAPAPPPDATFVAPIEMPTEVKPDIGLDLAGVEGGVPGGVEGGVPGGVLGGIVGGLPTEAPPPPVRAVRVGGQIKAPKLVTAVQPSYPELAAQARLQATVIMEALVDTTGRVKSVQVLRGAPLFDEAAIAAVKQWRYLPLLLNGVPTEFILTVTVRFNLNVPQAK